MCCMWDLYSLGRAVPRRVCAVAEMKIPWALYVMSAGVNKTQTVLRLQLYRSLNVSRLHVP